MAIQEIKQQDLLTFGNLEILANQVVEGFVTGLHKSPFHGFSVEFAEHRLYNAGDSVKNIDWKLFARTDRYFTKKFEEETNLRCQILIDASSSMYYPQQDINKFQFSVMSAACIINLLKRQRDSFGLTVFAEDIELHTPAKSTPVHQKYIYHELEKYLQQKATQRKTQLVKNLHAVADQIPKRSMIILFSDLFENFLHNEDLDRIFAALQHLKYNKHEVIIFNVADDKHELNFDFDNRPHHFIDIETGEEFKLNPKDYAEIYLQKMQHFRREIALKCGQYKIDYLNTSLTQGYFHTLQAWLLKRNKML
ncbi:DUF58 domain-containing protein [Pedobacter glucosidilyticus]|uniref:DUF58 domain-containing protein n=1 Tax=Pedobacter glucosidilyticus TaxID=1122941 RepID=UPI000409ABAF|nr:DUF58 domain-containing protein [Pedobacter glucosidilyticus]